MLNLDKFCQRKTKYVSESKKCKTKPQNNLKTASYEKKYFNQLFYYEVLSEW